MSLEVGASIGHYQIVEELGAGGNGRVLKVEHLITRRREAMKILAKGKPNSQESAHRFLREIRLQASLDHPNIAAVLNAFWLEDDLVMVMELIDGNTLQQLLGNRRFNTDQSMHLIKQVLNALINAHASSVVHRDVTTANIIVNTTGRVKLTDFGLAKGAADLSVTDSGGMIGSPYYISPEQVRGNPITDHRSDIYSTGVVLYELLTGTRPFEGESTFLLMQAHVQQEPQAPIERNAAIPQFISDAILKALAKDPNDRFQTATDFLGAIDGPPSVAPGLPEIVLMVSPGAPDQSVVALPAEISHSYAAAIPVDGVAATVQKSGVGRRIWTSATMGAILGIGVVIAAVAPVVFYDFESGRPRFGTPLKPVPITPTKRVSIPDPGILTPGPNSVPVFPQGASVRTLRPAASTRRAVPARVAPAPPRMVVWGEATSSSAPSHVFGEPALPAPLKAIELQPTSRPEPKATAKEAAPPGANPTVQRKSAFRRFAEGIKSLNPIRKDTPAASQP